MKIKKDQKIEELTASFGEWWNKGFEIPTMTTKLYPYKNIFSPIRINNCTIKNRIVMAPMGNINMCEETGRPSIKMLKYFEERAKGGVGLITSGLIPISYGIDKSLIEKGQLTYFPRIDRSRTVFSGWRDLTAMCHAHGSKFFIQLTPGLGRVGNPECLVKQHKFPRSASFNPNFYIKEIPCLRLSDRSLNKIVKNAGQSAADSKAANVDGVYLHGHEGYLLEQVTNPAFNRRKLGKYRNYERFGIDMVKEIRKRCGDNFPIMYRIDLSLALNETYKERMKTQKPLVKFKKGRTIDQTLHYMTNLVKAGVDMFDVDLGCYDNWWLPHPPSSMPSGCFLDISKIARDYFRQNGILTNKDQEVAVVAVGKLGYPDLAEKALMDKKCDMVMLGRPLLSDPEWVNKVYRKDNKKIIPCIGCQEGCLNEFVEGGHPQCAVNPRTGFEDEYTNIPKADKIKNIAIIGSGPAGITAAKVLVQKGHSVTMYEKAKEIGGQLLPASASFIKYEIKNYLTYLQEEVKTLIDSENFTLHLDTHVTSDYLKLKEYDTIILSTGAKIRRTKVKGSHKDNVFSANEVLLNPDLLSKYKKIAVVGGGVVGCETAYMISYELNKKCFVLEMGKYFMNKTCTANRGHIIHYLEENKVKLLNLTKLEEIKDEGIVVTQNEGKNVPDPYNTWSPVLPENVVNPLEKKIKDKMITKTLSCDAVVVAIGTVPDNQMYQELIDKKAAKEVFVIGDAFKSARVHDATRSAYRKAISI